MNDLLTVDRCFMHQKHNKAIFMARARSTLIDGRQLHLEGMQMQTSFPCTGAAANQLCEPEGCATVLGVVGGGGGTYIPQNVPHDTLIILNMHNWGKNFSKKFAHQLRLPSAQVRPGGRVGVKILFCASQPFLNFPQNSEYF